MGMEYVYAALLLHEAGKEINEENLKRIIEAVGISADMARIKSLVSALKNINIEEVISSAIVAPAAPAAPAPAAPAEEKAEEKPAVEEEKKKEEEEKKEEEALEGLGALFG